MDRVFLNDLRLRAIIGVYEWERHEPQELVLNVSLETDLRQAGASDDIADCIDYHDLALRLQAGAQNAQRLTVEALAADLAGLCLENPAVQRVRLRLEKPAAIHFARSAGVEIERGRG